MIKWTILIMHKLKQNSPESLQLSAPIPLTLHPAGVYLSGLKNNSYRSLLYCLNTIARILSQNQCDCMTLDWSKIRYHHAMALRAVLIDKYQPSTVNMMLRVFKRVMAQTQKLGLMELDLYKTVIDINNVMGVGQPKGRALSKDEIQQIMATCNGNSPLDIRDRAILGILRGGGLRRTELINLELQDVILENLELYIRNSKGHKSRKVFIPQSAILFLQEWLNLRGYEGTYLFCRIHRGGHLKMGKMHSDSIWRMLQKRAKLANIQSCCPHDLRRTFCGDLLSAGVDIVTVQKLAGHASPITTASYDRRGDEVKKRAVQNLGF